MKNAHSIVDGVARIHLTNGGVLQYAEIDEMDLLVASSIAGTWWAHWAPDARTFYCVTDIQRNNVKVRVYLHRLLMATPDGLQVDHFDHNGLNNRRSANLRNVTRGVNLFNRRSATSANRSGYPNVSTKKNKGRTYFYAECVLDKKRHYLGCFSSPILAYEAAQRFKATHLPRLFKET